jgi:general stress protein 26
MNPDAEVRREEALSFLVNHDSGVLSTVSKEGKPRSRMVYYTCDDSFNIFFITLESTRKVADLKANPYASFIIAETDMPRTLQVEGTIHDVTDTETMNPMITSFIRSLSSPERKHGIPLEHLNAATIKLYRINPSWLRWGDFTFARGEDKVFTLIDPTEE